MTCERRCEWKRLNGRLSEPDINEKSHPEGWLSEYEALNLPGTEPLTEGRAVFFGDILRMAADDLNMV